MNIIALPFYYFADPYQGRPLFYASVYVGLPDLDPETDPKDIFYEDETGTLTPAPNPVLTGAGGVLVDETGKPAKVVTDGAYSIRVRDKNGDEIYYLPNVDGDDISGGGEIFPPFTVITDTLLNAEIGGNYALDMSDDISKEITIPNGVFSDGDYFGVKVLNWTRTDGVSILVKTIDEEWEIIGDVTAADTREVLITQNGTFYFQKIGLKWSVVQGIGESEGTQTEREDTVTVDLTSLFVLPEPEPVPEPQIINKNLLQNSDFTVNQRNDTGGLFDESHFVVDRWIGKGQGDAAAAQTKGQLGYYLNLRSSNAQDVVTLSQRIEENLLLQGQTVTFSCEYNDVYISDTDLTATVSLQWIIVDGSTSSDLVTGDVYTLVDGNQGVEQSFTVPTITGYVNTNEYALQISIEHQLGRTADVVHFERPKLELSPVATPWVKDEAGENLANCQRFYYRAVAGVRTGTCAVHDGGKFASSFYLPVVQRADADSVMSTTADMIGILTETEIAMTDIESFGVGPDKMTVTLFLYKDTIASDYGLTYISANEYLSFDAELRASTDPSSLDPI